MHHHPEPSTPELGGSLGREKSPTKLPEPSMNAHNSHPHFPEAFKARFASANLLSIRSLVPAEELNDWVARWRTCDPRTPGLLSNTLYIYIPTKNCLFAGVQLVGIGKSIASVFLQVLASEKILSYHFNCGLTSCLNLLCPRMLAPRPQLDWRQDVAGLQVMRIVGCLCLTPF